MYLDSGEDYHSVPSEFIKSRLVNVVLNYVVMSLLLCVRMCVVLVRRCTRSLCLCGHFHDVE